MTVPALTRLILDTDTLICFFCYCFNCFKGLWGIFWITM